EVQTHLSMEQGSRLNWLPQETILFDRSALARTLNVELAADAQLLLCEPVLLGREAMDETVRHALFKDQWRIHRDGRVIHADQMAFGPDFAAQTNKASILNGARAFASVLLAAPDVEMHIASAREIIGTSGGLSYWNGKLLARLVAQDGYALRQRLMPLLSLLNKRAALPKCWSI
ncbi:MAG: urease accessory protein UreD, partial [Rhizobiaceae bacterium]